MTIKFDTCTTHIEICDRQVDRELLDRMSKFKGSNESWTDTYLRQLKYIEILEFVADEIGRLEYELRDIERGVRVGNVDR